MAAYDYKIPINRSLGHKLDYKNVLDSSVFQTNDDSLFVVFRYFAHMLIVTRHEFFIGFGQHEAKFCNPCGIDFAILRSIQNQLRKDQDVESTTLVVKKCRTV